jgi:molecular chaperone HtpG
MRIPEPFNKILERDQRLHGAVLDILTSFEPILKDNKLYFFEEYTDHGIDHIESVLDSAAHIVTPSALGLLGPKDITVLLLSVLLHDLGMHVEYATFVSLLNGEYDDVRVGRFDSKTWKELWEDFLIEAKRFSGKQRSMIFGLENQPYRVPDLTNKDRLDGADKKLIGEFIRRFHTRLAHEVALKGLIGKDGSLIEFGSNRLDELFKQLSGLSARSHGLNLRDTFEFLHDISSDAWKMPDQVQIVFLMVVLRIADYFQFHKERVSTMLLKMKTFNSPISQLEHDKHLAIEYVQTHPEDPERLYVSAKPSTSLLFVKISALLKDIQMELDVSWAILGEIYGKENPSKQPTIRYRRITSNFDDPSFVSRLNYIAQPISFEADVELPKLLVAPLYGNQPTFGIRELLQNAVDACRERAFTEKKDGKAYEPKVTVAVNHSDSEGFEVIVKDNGKGMTLSEIINYFLRAGSSFRKSLEWQREFTDDAGSSLILRNGRFGIGVLASFLLGHTIEVVTKSQQDECGFRFKTTLDQEQIEITIVDPIEDSGTEIRILTNKEIIQKLVDHNETNRDRPFGSEVPPWGEWYVLPKPSIEYTYLGKAQTGTTRLDQKKEGWYSFRPEGFGNVSWSFLNRKKYEGQMIACNGIFITDRHTPSDDDPDTDLLRGGVIRSYPSLLIDDPDGNLPLTLDRNKIDGSLPFRERLLRELSKELIASFLCAKIDPTVGIRRTTSKGINHADVIYTSNGFTFLIDFFLERLLDSGFRFVRILTPDRILPLPATEIMEDTAVIPKTQEILQIAYAAEYVYPNGGRVMLHQNKYDELFDPNKKRVSNRLKRLHRIESSARGLVVYSIDSNTQPSKFFTHLLKKYGPLVVSIQELEFPFPRAYYEWWSLKAGDILTSLCKKYFRSNYIIPYDWKARRKAYPLAFKELAEFMEPYVHSAEEGES